MFNRATTMASQFLVVSQSIMVFISFDVCVVKMKLNVASLSFVSQLNEVHE